MDGLLVGGDEGVVVGTVDDVELSGGLVVGTTGEVVVDSAIVVVLDEVVVLVEVVVDALTMTSPKEEISGTRNFARVRYPCTVRCTPSAINRLVVLGTKLLFQSDT